jgi:hypothetical protein
MPKKNILPIVGTVVGYLFGLLPLLISKVCGQGDEGICHDFFILPFNIMCRLFFIDTNTYVLPDTAMILALLAPPVFAFAGGIIGFLLNYTIAKIKTLKFRS